MTFLDGPVTVTVPATSANLGPGYDTLGLALGLRDRLTASVTSGGLEITVEGEGADAVPLDESHLVVRCLRRMFDELGDQPAGLRLHCVNAIPHARGLGSSSAAIVGGLALARALAQATTSDDQLFALAAEIEGHPDNVAPAVYGGLTISGRDGDGSGSAPFFSAGAPVDQRISAVVFIPPTGVETKVARGLIPPSVPHADAAADAGTAALLVAALAGQPEHLLRATKDYLHQEFRRPAMPDSLELVDALRRDGIPAVVSGAGPTVLAFVCPGVTDSEDALVSRAPSGWRTLPLSVERSGVRLEPQPA